MTSRSLTVDDCGAGAAHLRGPHNRTWRRDQRPGAPERRRERVDERQRHKHPFHLHDPPRAQLCFTIA